MSKKIGIPPTTFNRLVNGYSQPNITTLSKLLKNIPALKNCLPEEIAKAFEWAFEKSEQNYLPTGNGSKITELKQPGFEKDATLREVSFYNKEWKHENSNKTSIHKPALQKTRYVHEELENLLSDKYVFLCYVLALSKNKISKEEVQYNFGQKGLKAIDILINKNLLSKEKDNFYKVNEKNSDLTLSFQLMKKHVMFLAKQYDPDDVRHNYIHEAIEGLNEEGLDKLLKAHVEFHKKVAHIMSNKNYKGNKPFFSIACCDLVAKPIEQKQIREKQNVTSFKDLMVKSVQQKGG